MRFAKFAFGEAGDVFYRRLQRDPVKAMKQRDIVPTDPHFLDLIKGCTHPDPSQRFTLEQVQQHPYL